MRDGGIADHHSLFTLSRISDFHYDTKLKMASRPKKGLSSEIFLSEITKLI